MGEHISPILFTTMFEKAIKDYINRQRNKQSLPDAARWDGFRCVLFDMDGVLYNSMPHHAVAWHESMQKFGLHFTAEDAYATEGMRGIDTIRIYAKRQLGTDISEAEAQRMYDEKTRLFHLMPEAKIFEGVNDLMQMIKDADMNICVVTGSGQRPLIQRLVHDFGDFIDEHHIVSAYNIQRGKPAPDPYLKGLEFAGGWQPWQGIVVENAPLGVRAGVAAGCFTIGVNSGPLPDSALADEGAHIVLPSINELRQHWKDILSFRP